MKPRIKKIVIAGGGTAGWMTAAALGKVLGPNYHITLVESDAIASVGVGEATIPQMSLFNQAIGIDENAFMKATQATFKLGIEFDGWYEPGQTYLHPFGDYGAPMDAIHFHHYWLRLNTLGKAPPLANFSLATVAAYQGKFSRPINVPNSPLREIAYAFHLDATAYAKFLRTFSQKYGVIRREGCIEQVLLNSDTGFIEALKLANGEPLNGDFFIDCTGFRALLIEGALKTGYEDWSHLLPCDRAIAVQTEQQGEPLPYTKSIARSAGWQWRIPLQTRLGNGLVYCSQFISDHEAQAQLLENLEGTPLSTPKPIQFTTGKRKKFWHKNCVAIGLSSGFMEPLESTSIHLIQSAIAKLLGLFPSKTFNPIDIDTFNRQAHQEFDSIRDFLVLHYVANNRPEPFWQACRNIAMPDGLKQKIELFKSHGRIYRENNELFNETSWLAVMMGQGILPTDHHPLVDGLTETELLRRLVNIESVIQRSADTLPSHSDYIRQHCTANL